MKSYHLTIETPEGPVRDIFISGNEHLFIILKAMGLSDSEVIIVMVRGYYSAPSGSLYKAVEVDHDQPN